MKRKSTELKYEDINPVLIDKGLEFELQIALIVYTRHRYPAIAHLVKGDAFNGLQKLSPYMGTKTKAMGNIRGWPDIQIPIARRGYIGFFLELKRLKTRLKTKEGKYASEHIAEQAVLIQSLSDEKHFAQFGVGWAQCTSYTDWYCGDKTVWKVISLKK